MDNKLYDLADNYIKSFKEDENFKRLKYLNEYINKELKKELYDFNYYKDLYEKALPMKSYYPGFEELLNKFLNAKTLLYQNEYVKEYLKLEKELQFKLDELSNELADTISNKIKKKKIIR